MMSRVFLHFVGIFSWSGLHVGLLGVAYRKHVIDRDIEIKSWTTLIKIAFALLSPEHFNKKVV